MNVIAENALSSAHDITFWFYSKYQSTKSKKKLN